MIKTIKGDLEVELKPGSQDGQIFEIPNYGINDGKNIGKHYYKIKIKFPEEGDTDINYCLVRYFQDKKENLL